MADQTEAAAGVQASFPKLKTHQDADSYPSSGRAWWLVVVLLCAYTLSFIDRQILALMVGPIRADLNINDFQFSLLTGLAFAFFYSFLGVPIGWMADRRNRKGIISVGVGVWSVMTALCGSAGTFFQLFLFRIGVGVGEAALSPCAYSMVADSFPKDRRARPMGAYSMGTYVGAGIAMIFGGMIAGYITSLGPLSLPLFGDVKPWQATFIAVSLPAIPVLLLLMTVREPVRQDVVRSASGQEETVSIAATVRYIAERWSLYLAIVVGISFLAMISYATFNWIPEYFIRSFGWGRSAIGTAFGLIVLVFGAGGMFCAGVIADHLYKKGVSAATMRTARYSALILIVPITLAPLVPYDWLALILLAPGIFALGFHVGLGPSALQHITPNQMRGQVIAAYLLILNLLAQIVGPGAVGYMTSYVFRDDQALGLSISLTCGTAALIAIIVLTIASKKLKAYEAAGAIPQ